VREDKNDGVGQNREEGGEEGGGGTDRPRRVSMQSPHSWSISTVSEKLMASEPVLAWKHLLWLRWDASLGWQQQQQQQQQQMKEV